MNMDGAQEVPPNASPATGSGFMILDQTAHTLFYSLSFSGLVAPQTDAHIHGFAPPATSAGVPFPLPLGSPISGSFATNATQEIKS